jgi:hypothetical protein
VAQPGQFRLIRHRAVPDQLVQSNGQGNEPRYTGHPADRGGSRPALILSPTRFPRGGRGDASTPRPPTRHRQDVGRRDGGGHSA